MSRSLGTEPVGTFASLCEDPDAFRRWYDRALPVVYGFVLARCGGDATLAADVTQDAFVAAVRGRASFLGGSDPVTWVCAIARNKLVDDVRRRERERRRVLRLVSGPEPPSRSGTDEVDDRDLVLRTLQDLPDAQRTVLVLHYLDGLPVADIARALGRSPSATESLLTRARDSFRRRHPMGEDDREG